ncbi:hypothetical protein GQR58_015517 [Nymphon striatum]|nr:hypothetical protein GQR58_015517 [Nymphon striatum]
MHMNYSNRPNNYIPAKRISLPIVPVKVKTNGGSIIVHTYALLDTGSTNTFCTEYLRSKLNATGKNTKLSLTTMTQKSQYSPSQIISLEIAGINKNDFIKVPHVYTKENLNINPSNIPLTKYVKCWSHLQSIDLPTINSEIDLVIGQDNPSALIPLNVIRAGEYEPYATLTRLGWVINGPLHTNQDVSEDLYFKSANYLNLDDRLDEQLEKFWKVDSMESVSNNEGLSIEDKIVGKKPNLKEKYRENMNDLFKQGYAEPVPEDELNGAGDTVWYLPHHPVIQIQKRGKVRIVFDCAAKYKGESLNNNVLQGPDLTNKLLGVLLRIRKNSIGIMADINSMFHQVIVNPLHRNVLRFLWWPNEHLNGEPSVFQMTVHLFGGKWSPSCCNFALQKTVQDYGKYFSLKATKSVMDNFYVDNCLVSIDNAEEGVDLARNLMGLLDSGGFTLTKWVNNNQQVLQSIPEDKLAKQRNKIKFELNQMVMDEKALGVCWNVQKDSLGFMYEPKEKPLTRRGLLSMMSSIYDPFGLLNPFMVRGKKLIQSLFIQKLGWDDIIKERDQEVKANTHSCDCSEEIKPFQIFLNHYSSWSKLVRAAAWLKLFCIWLKTKREIGEQKVIGMSNSVLEITKYNIFRYVQFQEFGDPEKICKQKRGRLQKLDPYLDDFQVLRVGGRLRRADNIPEETKYPIIYIVQYWKRVQYLAQVFWSMEKKYLLAQQMRQKWSSPRYDIISPFGS